MTKKNAEVLTKEILNRYVQRVVTPSWIDGRREQKALAKEAGISPSAISKNKSDGEGLDLDSLEKIARAIGKTFLDLLLEAYHWHETGEQPTKLEVKQPHRRAAETAMETLGIDRSEVARLSASVYGTIDADDDPPPDWLAIRMLMERQRWAQLPQPMMTAEKPSTWEGWESARDEILSNELLHALHGPTLWFGDTTTTVKRPEPFTTTTLLGLVRDFAADHPVGDDRWSADNSEYDSRARRLYRGLRRKSTALRRPPRKDEIPPAKEKDQQRPSVIVRKEPTR